MDITLACFVRVTYACGQVYVFGRGENVPQLCPFCHRAIIQVSFTNSWKEQA